MMERILTVEQMRAADEFTISSLGISGEILTERAAAAVADEIKKRLYGGRVLVCIGKGNNGEDGKIIAKLLSSAHGFSVATINVSNGIFKMFDKKYDIIVDCIFGTGLNREVYGIYKKAIEKINASGSFVVACDIPSGLNGNTGKVMGVAVKANLTVAIQELKLGHFLNDGPDYCGEVISRDIGISIWGEDFVKRLNGEDVIKCFPERKRNVHKGNFGKVCILGGSKNFPGSALLSLSGITALKLGNGYVNLAVPDCVYNACAVLHPECTVTVLPDDGNNLVFDREKIGSLFRYDVIVVGMGMGVTEENYKIISHIIKNFSGRLVIDADGLNTLSSFGTDVFYQKKCDIVITPHIGEFSRLSGEEKNNIINDSIGYAQRFSEKYGITVVLKSAATVITDGKETYLNTTGDAGMAKAGSGDVLSGIIGGMLGKVETETLFAAASGCYLFGRAGEYAVKKSNRFCVSATDFSAVLPDVINDLS